MKTYARLLLTLILLFPVLTNCSATAQNKPSAGHHVQQELCVAPPQPEYDTIYETDADNVKIKKLLDNIVKLKFYAIKLRATIDCLRDVPSGEEKSE